MDPARLDVCASASPPRRSRPGGPTAGGKGPSIWDTFTRVPGAIADATDADRANEHYERVDQDFDLLAWLGVWTPIASRSPGRASSRTGGDDRTASGSASTTAWSTAAGA